jgi:hypothetical protein
MAPSQSTLHDLGNNKKSPSETAPLPLIPLDQKAPHCNECIEFTLKLDPTNANSSEYKFQMCYLNGTEDMHSILAWEDDINHVMARMGIVNATPMYVLYTQCMHRTAKSTFKSGIHMLTMTIACRTAFDMLLQ